MSGGSFEPLTTCGAALKSDLYERKQSYIFYVRSSFEFNRIYPEKEKT